MRTTSWSKYRARMSISITRVTTPALVIRPRSGCPALVRQA